MGLVGKRGGSSFLKKVRETLVISTASTQGEKLRAIAVGLTKLSTT